MEDDSKSAELSADKSKSTYASASPKKINGVPLLIFSESRSSSENDNESISSCEETSFPDTSEDDYDWEEEGRFFVLSSTGNRIIDLVNLQKPIVQESKSSKCGIGNIRLKETAREGLGSCLSLIAWQKGVGLLLTFTVVGSHVFFHINRLSVLTMRRIG